MNQPVCSFLFYSFFYYYYDCKVCFQDDITKTGSWEEKASELKVHLYTANLCHETCNQLSKWKANKCLFCGHNPVIGSEVTDVRQHFSLFLFVSRYHL